jgi:hypothetical protein
MRVRVIEANKRSLHAEPIQSWPAEPWFVGRETSHETPQPSRKPALRLPLAPV